MRTTIILFITAIAGNFALAQLPQLKPEVVEYYRLKNTVIRSENPKDFELLFKHPLSTEKDLGINVRRYAEALLKNNDLKNAEKYFLIAAEAGNLNSDDFEYIFIVKWGEPMPNAGEYVIPQTSANMEFKERVFKEMQKIEKRKLKEKEIMANMPENNKRKNILNSRNEKIIKELNEIYRRDQEIRLKNKTDRPDGTFTDNMREIDSINVWQLIKLIKENSDIDLLEIKTPEQTHNKIFIILLHALSHQIKAFTEFFEPYFRKRAEEGKGLDYCFYYDLYCVRGKQANGGESYYGEFGKNQMPSHRNGESEERNIEDINKHRVKVGLLPLHRPPTVDAPAGERQTIYLEEQPASTIWNARSTPKFYFDCKD
jgi:hypothetical protein